jgi:hypothetical protein
MAYDACKTGNLEQVRKVVSDGFIHGWAILHLTQTACVHNHPHIVYWLLVTYPLPFNLKNICYISTYCALKYKSNNDWNLILKRLLPATPATYSRHLMTHIIYKRVEYEWHMFQLNKPSGIKGKTIRLFLELEYSL